MEKLRALNPHLPMHHVSDDRFLRFGRVLNAAAKLRASRLPRQAHPGSGRRQRPHIASEPGHRKHSRLFRVRDTLFGTMPIRPAIATATPAG